MSEVIEILRKVLAENLGVEPEQVVDGADIAADLGADELDTIDIVISLEEELNVELDDSFVEFLTPGHTVAEIYTQLKKKVDASE